MMDKRGISFSTGVSATPTYAAWHKKGYKNVYTVGLDYFHSDTKRLEHVDLDYGSFPLALERSNLEMNSMPDWGGVRLLKSTITSTTYRGTKKVHEEVLLENEKNYLSSDWR